jgi:hypothetical protein
MADRRPLVNIAGALSELPATDRVAGHVASPTLQNIVSLTKATYDGLTPDVNTLYFVTDAIPAFYLLNQIKVSANITLTSGNVWCRVRTNVIAITVTLPPAPNDGDLVQFTDANGQVATRNITIARNGKTIGGAASDFTINTALVGPFSLIYDAANNNWEYA